MFNHTPPNMAEKRDVYTHQDEDAYPGGMCLSGLLGIPQTTAHSCLQ